MNYKTFTGETLSEALNKARLEFGNRVQLVDQKKKINKKGPFGIFGRTEFIEIIVNADSSVYNPGYIDNFDQDGSRRVALERLTELMKKKDILNRNSSYKTGAVEEKPAENSGSLDKEVYNEIIELKGALEKIVMASQHKTLINVKDGISQKGFEDVRNFLQKNDFEKYFIERTIEELSSTLTVKQVSDKDLLRNKLDKILANQIRVSGPIKHESNGPKMIVLVGPTGVGKTTTIAKIGAAMTYTENKRVEFLTIDNYRIGAREQIEKYSQIMGASFNIITSKEQLEEIAGNSNSDYLLLDTAGRNQKKDMDINEIKNFLSVVKIPMEVHLVVSATTKYIDLIEIMEKFEAMNYEKVIVTKVDETNTYGSVLSAISEKKKLLSYICMGQAVPDDIKIAEKQDLVTRIMIKFPTSTDFTGNKNPEEILTY